jgi:hypothetical protein
LKGQALAAASWHTDEDIVIFKAAFYDGFLVVFKLLYLRELAKNIVQLVILIPIPILPFLVVCCLIVAFKRLKAFHNLIDLYFVRILFFAD